MQSQKTSKFGTKSVTHSPAASVSLNLFLFSPHFDVICDLLLSRRMAICNHLLRTRFFLRDASHRKVGIVKRRGERSFSRKTCVLDLYLSFSQLQRY